METALFNKEEFVTATVGKKSKKRVSVTAANHSIIHPIRVPNQERVGKALLSLMRIFGFRDYAEF